MNGEYAVVNMWAPVAANQDKVKKEGGTYGWRFYPIFADELDPNDQDAANQYFSLTTKWNSKVINPKKVAEDQIPQILGWIDWNYSLKRLRLRAWGTPDMYTGDGMDRRYKPEFKRSRNTRAARQAGRYGGRLVLRHPRPRRHDDESCRSVRPRNGGRDGVRLRPVHRLPVQREKQLRSDDDGEPGLAAA